MHTTQSGSAILASVLLIWGCTSGHNSGGKGGSGGFAGAGGSVQGGGAGGSPTSSGGTPSASGGATTSPSGGTTGSGGTSSANGGTTATPGGGTQATGGQAQTGGTTGSGGKSGTGGSIGTNTGGIKTGGSTGTVGGNTSAAGATGGGGTTSAGGATGRGGTSAGGATSGDGTTSAGGATGRGGTSAGGATGQGGSTSTNPGSAIVSLDRTRQTMDGFGISDIGTSSSYSDGEADMLFDQTKGIGLSILRIAMGSDGNPMDYEAHYYSDIKKANARGAERIIGTLWSAPESYKTRDSANHGAHLNPEKYEDWATTIAAFPSKVKENTGVDLYAMSAQYEPDYCNGGTDNQCSANYLSMLYTPEEMVAFLKVVGPKLRALSPPVKVIAPEVSEWLRLWTNDSASRASDPLGGKYDYGHAMSKDTAAWAQVDIVGTHQYDTQVAQPWPSDVPQTKPVWVTEMAGIRLWPEGGPSSDIENGVAVAGWIHDAIVNGLASAWCWWSLRTYGTDDNEGLLLESGSDTKRHYTLGNYSKFIRPGYVRVEVAGDVPSDVLLSAYKGGDGTVVIVAINKGGTLATVPITISGGTAPVSLTPWVTSASDSLASSTAVTVTGGAFTATLASMTVTTFVGK